MKDEILLALATNKPISTYLNIFKDDLKTFKEILEIVVNDASSRFKNIAEVHAFLHQNTEIERWDVTQLKKIAIAYSECIIAHRDLSWSVYTGNLPGEIEYYLVLHGIETAGDCYEDIIPTRHIFQYVTQYLENEITDAMLNNLNIVAPTILEVVKDVNAFEEYLPYKEQANIFMSTFRSHFNNLWNELDIQQKIACMYLDYKTNPENINRLNSLYSDNISQNFITSLKTRSLFVNFEFNINEFTSIYNESLLNYAVDTTLELPVFE